MKSALRTSRSGQFNGSCKFDRWKTESGDQPEGWDHESGYQDISLKTVVRRLISSMVTTINLYGLDSTPLVGPHSKSLPHLLTIAHVY